MRRVNIKKFLTSFAWSPEIARLEEKMIALEFDTASKISAKLRGPEPGAPANAAYHKAMVPAIKEALSKLASDDPEFAKEILKLLKKWHPEIDWNLPKK